MEHHLGYIHSRTRHFCKVCRMACVAAWFGGGCELRPKCAHRENPMDWKTRSNNPHERIFLIGHSHGGSAVAYFLKNHVEEASKVDGCAFLSTPFVAIRRRNNASRIIGALTFFPILIATAFLGSLPPTGRYWGLLAVAIAALLGGAVFARSRRSTEHSIQQQTADIPDGRYLFLRCSGDEAAAALSSAQFIAWLGAKVSALLAQQIRPLFSSRAGCPSADNLRLVRRFAKRGSGSSGLEFRRPAADAASVGLR